MTRNMSWADVQEDMDVDVHVLSTVIVDDEYETADSAGSEVLGQQVEEEEQALL